MGGNDPLKFSDVFLFVMVTVSLTAPELTGLPVITKKKEKNYANLPSGSSAVPPGWGRAQRDALCGKFISFIVNFRVAACANK